MLTLSDLIALFWALLGPWQFLSLTLPHLSHTIRRLLSTGDYATLFSWQRLQDAWFSRFWSWLGPQIREGNGPKITALLQGRITNAQVVDEAVSKPIGGNVLDIGPGLGYWVDLYARTGEVKEDGIEKIYGIEPNTDVHAGLAQRAKAAGLDGVYEIVPAGIESISQASHIEKGSVDCIVSVLCLCSIPEPEKNIAELYSYLKKGGRWYLYEHVQAKGVFMKGYQGTLMRNLKPSNFGNFH